MKSTVTGVILAGGKNSRMGTDKGLLVVEGKSIVERIANVLNPFVNEIVIISNGNNYDFLGYKIYNDIIKECGPIGGIYTALSLSNTEKNFIVSCDMPNITKELVQFIIENSGESDISVPMHQNKLEPLCAIYDKHCYLKFEELIKENKLKLHDAINHFNTKYITIPETIFKYNCFANINTPSEFENLKSSNK